MYIAVFPEHVVSVQNNEMEVPLVERVVSPGHAHAGDIFFRRVSVHVVVSYDMVSVPLETVPHISEDRAGAVEPAEVAEFYYEIRISGFGGADEGCQPFFAVRNIRSMEIGSYRESYLSFLSRRHDVRQQKRK